MARSGKISKKLKEKQDNHNNESKEDLELKVDLNKTEMGQTYLQNKPMVIGIAVALIVLALGGVIWGQYGVTKNKKLAQSVFNFEQESLAKFKENTLNADLLIKNFNELTAKNSGNDQLGLLYFKVGRNLRDKDHLSEAIKVWEEGLGYFKDHRYLGFFFRHGLSAAYEDQGDDGKATKVLEEIISSENFFLKEKIYFDLGRLYLKAGKTSLAKEKFQHMVDNFKAEDNLVKMAKIKLQSLL